MPYVVQPSVETVSGYPLDPVVDRLTATPGIQRVPAPKLTLFVKKHFLDAATCAELIRRIDANRRPSEIADTNGDYAFRTSETCDLDMSDPFILGVDRRITDLTGIDPRHGEPMQGQRYSVGQEFKAHTDYFEHDGADFDRFCSVAGQRTWTAMFYLNDVAAGGATRFMSIDKIVKPETGKLLVWSNLRADGTPNPSTLHHAMKVRAGLKYVVTKWFRERFWG